MRGWHALALFLLGFVGNQDAPRPGRVFSRQLPSRRAAAAGRKRIVSRHWSFAVFIFKQERYT